MTWPALPWTTSGNWYSEEGTVTTGQAQEVDASGGIEIIAQVGTGQKSQSVSGGLYNGLHIIGGVTSGQGGQTSNVVANPNIFATIGTAQAVSSTAGAAYLEITATASTGQADTAYLFGFSDPDPINVSLQKMLKYPHAAVFDTDAEKVLALLLDAEWSIVHGVMTVTHAGITRKFALGDATIGQVVGLLEACGIPVTVQSEGILGLGAHILLDGSGSPLNSNGNHIYAYSALIWALFGGYSAAIDVAAKNVVEALRQMVITQSQDDWLDLWGTLYNQPRPDGMHDDRYQEYIPREAFRKRINALAIQKAVFDATGKVVKIEEPWEFMFRLDESRLSGGNRFFDGRDVGYFRIRPVSTYPMDFTDVLEVIERNRAAGVVVLDPEVRFAELVIATMDGTCSFARTETVSGFAVSDDGNQLDYMRLDLAMVRRNYPVAMSQLEGISLVAECPVAADYQTYSLSGVTWNSPNTWGDFTWNGDGAAVSGSEVLGSVYSSVSFSTVDYVQVN